MANIPGFETALPGVYSNVVTLSNGITLPAGTRIVSLIGEGSTDETIITQALGKGNDGLNPSYTSSSGADGRHFRLSNYPIVSNRTTIFKNGIPLIGLEQLIDNNTFNSNYDYRINITTGEIELQKAHLKDQGGTFYSAVSTNVGVGVLNSLTLIDLNTPPEIWTLRCVYVQRDALNSPIAGTAQFIAIGSISGAQIDANGNPIVWKANNQIVSNGIISLAIQEQSPIFRQGDAFTIIISSGVLVRNDSLTVNYIPISYINDPVLVTGMNDVLARHGSVSISNNLSLGAKLAFSNKCPPLYTVQAAPPLPRRTSYILSDSVNSLSSNDDDFIFPLPLGVVPDFNSNIHFFITNNSTNVETQILPNKLIFYKLGTTSEYPTVHDFITSNISAPAGYSFFYTVISEMEDLVTGDDGYITRSPALTNHGVFSSSIIFDSTYVGKVLKIIDSNNVANIATYNITSVVNGKLYVTLQAVSPYFADFTNEGVVTSPPTNPVAFQLINMSSGLAVTGGSAADGYIVKISGTATATLGSPSINFSTLNVLTNGYKLQINGSSYNDGLYDITSYDSINNVLTIRKAIVSESNLRYEVLDPSQVSNYIVINKNVVTPSYGLRITIVDYRDVSFYDAGWLNALASLEAIECDIVVPLPKQTISAIFQNTLSHCQAMSNIENRKERVMIVGAISGLTPSNLTGAKPAAVEDIGILEGIQGETQTDILNGNIEDLANYSVANAWGETYRCIYCYPDQIVVQAGTDMLLIDGIYIAPAVAGYLSADSRLANPITNKVISGFTILRNKQFSTSILKQLAQAGVTVLQPVTGGGEVVWGITTSQSGYPEEQEISIVSIRDYVSKALRYGYKAFIGKPESEYTQSILNARGVILLNDLITNEIITAWKNLVVIQDPTEPRQYDITVSVAPVYPTNWIYIKATIGQV